MSQASNSDNFEILPEVEGRLNHLASLFDGDEALHSLLERRMRTVFKTDGIIAPFIGGDPGVVSTVQESLVSSLEKEVEDDSSGNSRLLSPFGITDYFFKHPDKATTTLLRERTDYLKQFLMLDGLHEALARSGGRYIHAGFELTDDYPESEYKWVSASADDHTYFGITYRFYKDKPEQDDSLPTVQYKANLQYKDQRSAPDIVTDEYPYYAGLVFYTEFDERLDYEDDYDEGVLDVPEDIAPLIRSVTETLITEELVKQFNRGVETTERARELLNRVAKDIVASSVDPTTVRNRLEKIGIYEDPENFS